MSANPSPLTAADAPVLFDSPPRGFIDVGHSELAYRSVGSGPDLLFVHGWPVNSSTWRQLVAHLAPSFTCHLLDLPGAGDTRFDRSTPMTLPSHARALKSAVDALGLERYGVVAFDSGGAIARILAAQDDRIAAMVLSGTEIPGHHSDFIERMQSAAKLPGAAAVFGLMLRSSAYLRSKWGLGGCFDDLSLLDETLVRLEVRPLLDRRDTLWAALELLRHFDMSEIDELEAVHRRMEMPVQLIWGGQDPFFPAGLAQEMAGQFPDARFHLFERGKLFVHQEFAGEYAEIATPVLMQGLG